MKIALPLGSPRCGKNFALFHYVLPSDNLVNLCHEEWKFNRFVLKLMFQIIISSASVVNHHNWSHCLDCFIRNSWRNSSASWSTVRFSCTYGSIQFWWFSNVSHNSSQTHWNACNWNPLSGICTKF